MHPSKSKLTTFWLLSVQYPNYDLTGDYNAQERAGHIFGAFIGGFSDSSDLFGSKIAVESLSIIQRTVRYIGIKRGLGIGGRFVGSGVRNKGKTKDTQTKIVIESSSQSLKDKTKALIASDREGRLVADEVDALQTHREKKRNYISQKLCKIKKMEK